MTEPPAPRATGGMSRSGTTTVVKINRPEVAAGDKKILCTVICEFDKAEMKFPPDELSRRQRAAYVEIAGGEDKFATLKPENCDCGAPDDPTGKNVPVKSHETAGEIAKLLTRILRGGRAGFGAGGRQVVPGF